MCLSKIKSFDCGQHPKKINLLTFRSLSNNKTDNKINNKKYYINLIKQKDKEIADLKAQINKIKNEISTKKHINNFIAFQLNSNKINDNCATRLTNTNNTTNTNTIISVNSMNDQIKKIKKRTNNLFRRLYSY